MDKNDFKQQIKLRAFNLARRTIQLSNKFSKTRAAWVITDQLIRAITSIGANIIEAQAASSRKDFINYLHIALKSGNESKFWLALARDLDAQLIVEINEIIKETDELVKILGKSLLTLKGK